MKSPLFHIRAVPTAIVSAVLLTAGCTQSTHPETQITDVNEEASTITAKRDDQQVLYDVAPEANLTRDDRPAELKDLQAGDRMDVELQQQDGVSVATRVEAISPEKLQAEESSAPQSEETPPPHPVPYY